MKDVPKAKNQYKSAVDSGVYNTKADAIAESQKRLLWKNFQNKNRWYPVRTGQVNSYQKPETNIPPPPALSASALA